MEDAEWYVKRTEIFAPKTAVKPAIKEAPSPVPAIHIIDNNSADNEDMETSSANEISAATDTPAENETSANDETPSIESAVSPAESNSAPPTAVPPVPNNVILSSDGVSVSATDASGSSLTGSSSPAAKLSNPTPGVLKPAIAKTPPPRPAVPKPAAQKTVAPKPVKKPRVDDGGWKKVDFTPEELKLMDAKNLRPEPDEETVMESGARRFPPEDFPVLAEFPPIDDDRIKPVPRGDTQNAPYVRGKSGKCPQCKSDLEEFISFCIYCGTKKEN